MLAYLGYLGLLLNPDKPAYTHSSRIAGLFNNQGLRAANMDELVRNGPWPMPSLLVLVLVLVLLELFFFF